MQFEGYRSNIRTYLADFYRYFEGQFKDRPVSSYSIIFEDEAAEVNRYIQGVVDEISYEVREELERQFGRAESGVLYERYRSKLPRQDVKAFTYVPKRAAEPARAAEPPRGASSFARASASKGAYAGAGKSIPRPRVTGGPRRLPSQRLRIAAVGVGVVLGGLASYSFGKAAFATAAGVAIGKTALATFAGMAIGGVVLLVAYELMRDQKPKQRKYVTLNASTQAPPRPSYTPGPAPGADNTYASPRFAAPAAAPSGTCGPDIKQVLAERHRDVSRFILALVDQMENNYREISKSAV